MTLEKLIDKIDSELGLISKEPPKDKRIKLPKIDKEDEKNMRPVYQDISSGNPSPSA